MALYKEIELDNGVIAKYWHITRIEVLKDQPMAWVQLYGFVSEEARFSGKFPCHNEMMEVVLPVNNSYTHADLYSAVYTWIKENNGKFEGAQDILVDALKVKEDVVPGSSYEPTTVPELG